MNPSHVHVEPELMHLILLFDVPAPVLIQRPDLAVTLYVPAMLLS
jgi:hypothetical protein